MRMIRIFLLAAAMLTSASVFAAEKYNYIAPGDLKAKIEGKAPLHLLDIQVQEGFCEHHLPGAVATYAYPVKTAEERAKLDAVLARVEGNSAPVVIVCPRGGGGAERAYDHLAAQGVPRERLFILEKGQEGWPYPEMIQKTK